MKPNVPCTSLQDSRDESLSTQLSTAFRFLDEAVDTGEAPTK